MPSAATETKPPTTTTTPEPVTRQQKEPVAQTKEPASAPGQTLAGVLIPGGALSGLIGFCWLSHQFGLPAVLLAVVACSAVATAALVVKTGRRIRRSGAGRLGRASSRSPGTRHRAPSVSGSAGRGGAGGGRVPAARSGTGSLARRGGSSAASGALAGAARKPGGPAASKLRKPLASAPNTAGGQPASLGRNAAATGGTGRRTAPATASPRTARKPGAVASLTKPGAAGMGGAKTGAAGRLARTLGRKSPTTAAHTGGSPKQGSAPRRAGSKGGYKAAPQHGSSPATTRARKAAKAMGKAVKGNRGQVGGRQPNTGKLKAQPKPQRHAKKKTKPATGKGKHTSKKQKRQFAPAAMSALRRGQYWAGRKLRKHTSALARHRLRKAAVPFRAGARAAARYGSPLLAHAWRLGSRALLNGHLALGSVRFSTMGPNWLRPLARVFHTLTTPAARALAWAGTWGWLNRWMYRHTGVGTTPTTPRRPAAASRRTSTVHRPVHSPTRVLTPATNGVPVSSIEPALPLQYAADAVRTAGAMMVLNPAANMIGYESTINSLAEIQRAIGDVIAMAAHSSRENFKVNPAIPDAYDDTAVYAHALAGRLDSIPTLYRIIHAEQIDNIENPTVQGAKWDQSANWQ
ncbi:hypothetical protein AB0I82_17090 [Streptomyces sp. NPDC050315]|uniref:hypothetical protein n=1 Tax=Streptomyces sp. NPDC050315 TaxID=3155039 RepID=UPI00342665F6